VRLGQIAEHLVPVLRYFKYDPKKAHFLGMPVDYIIFENDKIVFLEVKTGRSSLSRTQRDIKKLITEGKVVWEEIRLTPEVVTLEDRENTIKTLQKSGLELKV
jgi:predicted Holliday junction resolvase-like endonuclease